MIADLKPYPEYKKSGLSWLGKVPEHWEVRPTFGVFTPNYERNCGMKERTVLSLSYGCIVIKPVEKLHGLVPESFETYQILNPGDIVLRTTDLQNDHTSLRVGMVRHRGIITSAYLGLKTKKGVIPDYGFQFLNVWDTNKAIYGYGSGLRQNLDFSHFKRMPIALPPPSEQAAIVRFLDWANGRLEKAIRAKRKVIALLNEQKQAIIHRAVTRGLDPNVPLKDSGIPWLGKIPRHWEVMPFMRLFAEVYRYPTYYDIQYVKSGVPEVRGEALVHGNIVVLSDQRYIAEETNSRFPRTILKEGDLVMSVRGTMGKIGVVGEKHVGANITANLLRLSPRQDVVQSEYLSWFMRSPGFLKELDRVSPQTTIKTITMPQLAGLRLCVPPPSEQCTIGRTVEKSVGSVNVVISRLEREIALLREYRTRLVADIVTGKLDVREAAKGLPEEKEEEEKPDGSNLSDGSDGLDRPEETEENVQ